MAKNKIITVEGREISVVLEKEMEYISLTDMLKILSQKVCLSAVAKRRIGQ